MMERLIGLGRPPDRNEPNLNPLIQRGGNPSEHRQRVAFAYLLQVRRLISYTSVWEDTRAGWASHYLQ